MFTLAWCFAIICRRSIERRSVRRRKKTERSGRIKRKRRKIEVKGSIGTRKTKRKGTKTKRRIRRRGKEIKKKMVLQMRGGYQDRLMVTTRRKIPTRIDYLGTLEGPQARKQFRTLRKIRIKIILYMIKELQRNLHLLVQRR